MEPFIGQVSCFAFDYAPRGWAPCNGQLLAITQYQALFSLLGTSYGGDGRTTFGLPDLRDAAPVSAGGKVKRGTQAKLADGEGSISVLGMGWYIAVDGVFPPRS